MKTVLPALMCAFLTFAPVSAEAAAQIRIPSGQPEGLFRGLEPEQAITRVANQCMTNGWMIVSQGNGQIVCEYKLGVVDTAFARTFLGNRWSTPPRGFIRVSVAALGADSRAQATGWVETQMAFGQTRQQPFASADEFNGLVQFLMAAGARLPDGSQIPGVWLGAGLVPFVEGKAVSLEVRVVTPGSPAAAAGLLVGDQVIRVGGKGFKSFPDFKAKLDKRDLGAAYPLDILRNGRAMTLQPQARLWPVAGSPEDQALQAATEPRP